MERESAPNAASQSLICGRAIGPVRPTGSPQNPLQSMVKPYAEAALKHTDRPRRRGRSRDVFRDSMSAPGHPQKGLPRRCLLALVVLADDSATGAEEPSAMVCILSRNVCMMMRKSKNYNFFRELFDILIEFIIQCDIKNFFADVFRPLSAAWFGWQKKGRSEGQKSFKSIAKR